MIIDELKLGRNDYKFKVIYDFWADPVIEILENDMLIGRINNKYSLEEVKESMQKDSDFRRMLLI
ncbi:hypothetical protein ACF0HT_14045 (plasmid) [Staphylococcus xylosus]|uniref:hypothetical protein n=1 Tax=Staphylococcus xylosus TaxID=1288 RepID=UPI002DBE5F97|nr:hypothetical protein [Staphylococcus xylosus]MEB8123121.1 hypothetical protein [Staphylococcus xylosus]